MFITVPFAAREKTWRFELLHDFFLWNYDSLKWSTIFVNDFNRWQFFNQISFTLDFAEMRMAPIQRPLAKFHFPFLWKLIHFIQNIILFNTKACWNLCTSNESSYNNLCLLTLWTTLNLRFSKLRICGIADSGVICAIQSFKSRRNDLAKSRV